ncbi:MAG: amino acid ABC transporter permease [Candidatus Brocadiales bacterium]|nr:amino acid ABC transporter permease [Candidatus Brocadiales bacterium]
MLKGLLRTIVISSYGLCLGALFSILLAIAMIMGPPSLQFMAKSFSDFFRSTPFLIQLFGIYFGLPSLGITLEPFYAAVLTMALHSSAYLGEVLVSGYNAIPNEQMLASQLLGLKRWQSIRHIILPQMVPLITAPSLNTIVATIKDSSIVSVISVYELTMQAQQLISTTFRPFEFYFLTAILYACMTYPLILIGRKLDKQANQRKGIA